MLPGKVYEFALLRGKLHASSFGPAFADLECALESPAVLLNVTAGYQEVRVVRKSYNCQVSMLL